MSNTEIATRLDDLHSEMKGLVRKAQELVRLIPDKTMRLRAEKTWLANIRMALDTDHDFLGGQYVTTMRTTIEELDPQDQDPYFCADNDCEAAECHRCFPVRGCNVHDKCRVLPAV